MGNYFSPYPPEYEQRQPRHHQGYPQKQQQQHHPQSSQGRQYKQPRHISSFSTSELLNHLESICEKTSETIRNTKKGNWFYKDGKEEKLYICSVMIDTENQLRQFNLAMQKTSGMSSAAEKEIHRLNEVIKELQDTNHNLFAENRYTASFMQEASKGSNQQAGPMSVGHKYNGGRGNQMTGSGGTEQEKLKGDLEKERRGRAGAISYAEHLKKELDEMTAKNKKQSEDLRALSEEKNSLVMRLSKMAGQRLTQDNPAIADLSDPNRPTKLGEMYSEIYDNEWTDAFEALNDAKYEEGDAIETLRLTLLNIFEFCSKKSETLLKKTEEAVNILFEEYKETETKNNPKHLTMPRNLSDQWGKLVRRSSFGDNLGAIALQERWKPKLGHENPKAEKSVLKIVKPQETIHNQLKIFRREVAESMVPVVEKAYIAASWNDKECIHLIKPFIKKCILLGWMMVVQSPPMTFAESIPEDKFNKDMYKEYTVSGNKVSFVVWPALLLTKDGPVLGKGVAQGMRG